MLVYLSILGIINLVGKLATSAPSKSSQVITLCEALICLNLCSSLSIHACGSSKVRIGNVTEGETTSIWLCKVKGIRCGANWLGGEGGGTIVSNWALSWTGTYWVCCPSIIWPRLAKASWIEAMVTTNWSTVTICESISLWYDLWFDWSNTLVNLPPTPIHEGEFRLITVNPSTNMETLDKVQYEGDSAGINW